MAKCLSPDLPLRVAAPLGELREPGLLQPVQQGPCASSPWGGSSMATYQTVLVLPVIKLVRRLGWLAFTLIIGLISDSNADEVGVLVLHGWG